MNILWPTGMIGALFHTTGAVLRVSYSGYYECFPSTRGGFDSRYPLHRAELDSPDTTKEAELPVLVILVLGVELSSTDHLRSEHEQGWNASEHKSSPAWFLQGEDCEAQLHSALCLNRAKLDANLAQLVEQCFRKAEVPGSIPGVGSTKSTSHRRGAFLL